MLTLLALYGPESLFGMARLGVRGEPPAAGGVRLVIVVIIRVALAAWARYRPPEPSAGEFVVPPDPEATASYLRDRARDKRQR